MATIPTFPAAAAPDPGALAALGPVLCLHDAREPNPLSGWRRAVRAHACLRIDADGPSESIRFEDADGRPCWQLLRLPDSDFLAWERLVATLPGPPPSPPVPARPRWPWTRRDALPCWRSCALRLHVLCARRWPAALVVADVDLSGPGRAAAHRLLRSAGLPGDVPRPP